MKAIKNEQEEYLLIRIKTPFGVNFYSEHKKIIDRYGYVDFAKVGGSLLNASRLKTGDTIFIKESISNGGALYAATLKEIVEKENKCPDYYKGLEIGCVFWLRLSNLILIENYHFLDDYRTRKCKPVSNALKSVCPCFFIHKKIRK